MLWPKIAYRSTPILHEDKKYLKQMDFEIVYN